jgi:hypothetical protein
VRRGVLVVCAAVVASASVACGLTASFAGLQGGTLPDAGADAGGAVDAGWDADVDATVVDAGPHFCATLATPVKLCDDFDEGQSVEAGWSATDLYGGEAIAITNDSYSPPAAFSSAINPSDAPSSARLLENLPTESSEVHVEFEMLLTSSSETGTIQLAVVHEVTSDGTTYGLYYQEVNGALQAELRALLSDGSTYDQSWPIGNPPTSWTRVDMDMSLLDDGGAFTVQQDGTPVVSQSGVPTSTDSRAALFVELGLYSYTPAGGSAVFDNAIVDWQ